MALKSIDVVAGVVKRDCTGEFNVMKIGEASLAATHRAVMSYDVKFRKIQNIRRGITLEHREPSRKPYI